MGSTSSSQIANSLAQNISNTTMSSLQSSAVRSYAQTDISAICDQKSSTEVIQSCKACGENSINYCSTQVTSTHIPCSPEQIDEFNKLCATICNSACSITDINVSNDIVVFSDNQIKGDSFSKISDDIKEQLNQSIKDTSANQTINNKINNITNVLQKTLQSIANSTTSSITIKARNAGIHGVTANNFVKQVSDTLLSDSTSSSVINKAAVQISQSAEGTYKWIIIVGAVLISLMIIIFMILMLAKSKDLKDFFSKMLPVFIWLFLCLVTTVVLIFTKPKIVTSVNVETKKEELNVASLILWLSVFYIGYGLILFTIWKIKNHKSSKKSKGDEKLMDNNPGTVNMDYNFDEIQ